MWCGLDMKEYIVTVDEQDRITGSIEKLEAHIKGVLHRAFSIVILNDKKEILLQKRDSCKYHSPGLWSNTCCSHQRVGETLSEATNRRLLEEMGFTCELTEIFHFIYQTKFDNDLTEHELDHVFVGQYHGDINVNPSEVEDYKWISYDDLMKDMKENAKNYTYWFHVLMNRIEMKEYLS